ncbi:hypothetical protein BKP45_01070 [Anaerobacillus alkalidiazotrophicus]|uniref:Uncharacterized protein n=1 Tax=Anaerobacillus alkalidiazotrophicus TaxID=472963 RepID=A0A1S2M9D4_9BACI|nr:Ger(x)C family spore germination protein [Anaerobacillus alkalidiazotrophicus]OIJ21402.1 hypothetical protein BKP45_01070 [Anaerobacillus alkalidiazotrophicus]
MFKWALIVMIIFQFSVLSGCWNAKEITELSIISAVGVDKTDKGEFLVSFQLINASEVATGQEGGSRNASTTVVVSSTGDTLFEAIRKATQSVPRKLYFPHTNLIVISEEIAQKVGIEKIIDWFERDHEIRTNIQVVIARGTRAEDVLMVQSAVERISAKKITNELETSEKAWGENLVTEVDDIIQALVSNGKEITITGIKLAGNKIEARKVENLQQSKPPTILEVSGIGMFREGKLVQWIDNEAARGLLWILNRIKSTIVNLDYQDQRNCISIEVLRSQTKVSSVIKNGKPTFYVSINTEGNIAEVDCPVELEKHETIKELEIALEEIIENEAMKVVTISQNEKSDIFGFGNVLQRQYPRYWKKNEENWPNLFSTSDVNIVVNAFIRRTGMRTNPFNVE